MHEGTSLFIGFIYSATTWEDALRYRVLSPARALAGLSGIYTVVCREDAIAAPHLAAAADLLILYMTPGGEHESWLEMRRADGCPTILEIAADITSPSGHPELDDYLSDLRLPLLRAAVRVDALQFPCPGLQERFAVPGVPSVVFPSQMDDLPPLKTLRKHKPVVVGWGGPLTDHAEMARLAPLLEGWARARGDILLAILGDEPVQSLFKSSPPLIRRYESGSLEDYYQFLSGLDIGIAPLADTPHNRSRSDVMFLEYAAFGAAAVVQDAPAYRGTVEHDVTGRFFRSGAEMIQMLDGLVMDPQLRFRICHAAYDYVESRRRTAPQVPIRWDFYRRLVKTPRPNAEDRFITFCVPEGANPGPTFHMVQY